MALDPEDEKGFPPVVRRGKGLWNPKRQRFETWEVIFDRQRKKKAGKWKEPITQPLPPAVDPEDEPTFNPMVRRGHGQYNRKSGRFETWDVILQRYAVKQRERWAKESAEKRKAYARKLIEKSLPALVRAMVKGAIATCIRWLQGEEWHKPATTRKGGKEMSVALKTALVRLGRAMAYGAVSAGMAHLLVNVGDFVTNPVFIPLATAVLMAADKFVRESLKPVLTGEDSTQ